MLENFVCQAKVRHIAPLCHIVESEEGSRAVGDKPTVTAFAYALETDGGSVEVVVVLWCSIERYSSILATSRESMTGRHRNRDLTMQRHR